MPVRAWGNSTRTRKTIHQPAITKEPGIYAGVFSYFAFMDFEIRSSSFKNSAVSSSSLDLEGGLRRRNTSDIGLSFVQTALYALLTRNCCISAASAFLLV